MTGMIAGHREWVVDRFGWGELVAAKYVRYIVSKHPLRPVAESSKTSRSRRFKDGLRPERNGDGLGMGLAGSWRRIQGGDGRNGQPDLPIVPEPSYDVGFQAQFTEIRPAVWKNRSG